MFWGDCSDECNDVSNIRYSLSSWFGNHGIERDARRLQSYAQDPAALELIWGSGVGSQIGERGIGANAFADLFG